MSKVQAGLSDLVMARAPISGPPYLSLKNTPSAWYGTGRLSAGQEAVNLSSAKGRQTGWEAVMVKAICHTGHHSHKPRKGSLPGKP